MRLYIIIFFCCYSMGIMGQSFADHITIHSRVDTSDTEVREVVQLWINYLNSNPDSISDNPYWNHAEKELYEDFDLSRKFLYQFPSNQLLPYFKPTILSVEKEGELYGIRTIFYADGLTAMYRKSNPWCITKLYAVKEKNEWKLKNALPVITKNWNKKTIGKITFIYPPEHLFDEKQAVRSNLFCEKIMKDFGFPGFEPFDFYITNSVDDLGKLLNFDFFYAGYTTGVGMKAHRILLSGLGSEFYPHECIHLIIPEYNTHAMIEEGFATWQGGCNGKSFEENAHILANQIALNSHITITDVLEKKWGWQYNAYYTTGAILCKAVYDKGGIPLLKNLFDTKNNDQSLMETISITLGIKQSEIDQSWKNELLKYRDK